MLKSERITFESFKSSDLADLYEVISNEELTYPAGFKPVPDLKTCRLSLQYRIASKQYVKLINEKNEFIGEINFYKDQSKRNPNAYEIGFIINSKYHRKGYATEALKTFIPYFYNHVDIDILSAHVFVGNVASKKTLEKIGFHEDGIIRHYKKMFDGKMLDAYEFSLTRDEIERKIETWKEKF